MSPPLPVNSPQVETLVTAAEAYPRLEQLFLSARSEIDMGFRLFDPRTRLQSDIALQTGKIWADLFVHTLNRGVAISLTLSDFDPTIAFDLHEQAWQFVAICEGISAMTEPGAAKLTVRCLQHPAQGGIIPRLMFAPRTRATLQKIIDQLNTKPDPAHHLDALPGLHGCVQIKNAKARMRPFALPRLFPVTLHHKLAVFDGQITYIGGLDLNNRRYDDHDHNQAAQDTWHDVQLVIPDPAIAEDARTYLRTLPQVISGEMAAPRFKTAFLTTLSRKRSHNAFRLAPQTVSSKLLKAHLAQIKQARSFIYLETQFFRDRRIAKALARAGRRNRDLKLLLLLPAAPEDVAFSDSAGIDGRFGEYLQARAIRQVRRAFGTRFLAVSPAQRRKVDGRDADTPRATLAQAPIIYVHAKLSLFDHETAIVSSANLNGRSMKWDSEAGVLLNAPEQVSSVLGKVFEHWLAGPVEQTFLDPKTAFDAWHAVATENAAVAPELRRGFLVPYATKPAARTGMPIPGAPEEMV